MKQSNEKTFRGVWWSPSNPDIQWDGKAKWKPKQSPRLKLHYRSVGATPPPDFTESFLGIDSSGSKISILRAGSGGSTRSGLLSSTRYSAGHILKGVHIGSLTDIRLNRLNVWFQNLGAWVGEEGFNSPHRGDQTTRIEYTRPADRTFQIASNLTLHLAHSSTESARARERKVSYDVFLGIEKARPVDFKKAFLWIESLRALLHFARLRPIHATAIKFENFDHRFSIGTESYPKEVILYGASIADPLDREPHTPDFVFTFKDVKDRMADLCSDWFRFCIEYREALGCYTTTVYHRLTPELRLISFTQALEAYHERCFRPQPKSEEAHFVNRVKHLCRTHAQFAKVVSDIDLFSESVRDSRHYYTHHDPDIKRGGKVLSGAKLSVMTYQLEYLFRLCVLTKFQLDADPHQMLRRQLPDQIVEYY